VSACTLGTLSLLDQVEDRVAVDELGQGRTLDDVVVALWDSLGAHRTAECPVCGDEMAPVYAAHARAVGGRCANCGSMVQ
jgi:hypothetical protein